MLLKLKLVITAQMNTEYRFNALISISVKVVNWINDDMRHETCGCLWQFVLVLFERKYDIFQLRKEEFILFRIANIKNKSTMDILVVGFRFLRI